MKNKIISIVLILPGFLFKFLEMAKDGARDLKNKILFTGAIIEPGCNISPNTSIEAKTRIFYNVTLNNCKIGKYSYVGSNCFLQNVSIGKFCSIAKHSLIGLGAHPSDFLSTSPLFYRKNNPLKISFLKENKDFVEYQPIEIGHDVWVGARVTIMDGVKIGTGAIVASGAVVTKNVPPYAIVGGVPAKIIKYRFDEEQINKLLNSSWWDWDLEKINKHKDLIKKQNDSDNI